MAEYFAMGGYGAYVWPSYAITALVMIVAAWASVRDLKQRQKQVKALQGFRRRGGRDEETIVEA